MKSDPLKYFRLNPIKAARVSEVSEATASSDIPSEERVNFHIGNPVQDKELFSAYLRIALGIDIRKENLTEDNLNDFVEELGWSNEDKKKIELILSLIKKSAPYMPRGGFNKKDPNYLAKYFSEWLTKQQQEPLSYDLGNVTGNREVILASGGVIEALRILFHALSSFLTYRPATIFLYDFSLPEHLQAFESLEFKTLPSEEKSFLHELEYGLKQSPSLPTFLVLGGVTKEETRRNLRQLSLEYPLFFIEVNDAPNHLSLAREAKMMNRVLRILTPGIFSPELKNLSTVFVAGSSDMLKVVETIQFQLKGTPSASEVELLSFLLKENVFGKESREPENEIVVEPAYEHFQLPILGDNPLKIYAKQFEDKLSSIIEQKSRAVEDIITNLTPGENYFSFKTEQLSAYFPNDKFSGKDTRECFDEFVGNIHSDTSNSEVVKSFLSAFLGHHPEYDAKNALVVSGSSRTALGLLGFHCGIREVVIPDLSWTYEHCFPSVSVIPLTDDYELDVDGIIREVKNKLAIDSNWKSYGAVALNNPHNATGQEFNSDDVKRLVKWLLERNIFVIDDLSYQNVAPIDGLKEIKTIRQLTDELHGNGYISDDHAKHLVTVHSLSKTDSFAGARLSVIEIRHDELYQRFKKINDTIKPNIAAIFTAYLFYRSKTETANAYWRLRNKIFKERMDSLEQAVDILPKVRNRFDIKIKAPKGSMYPQMIIDKLPSGLSLDWLSSGLARQGIGLVPLSTFARTEKGFEIGRKTFRLTLGGTDNAEILLKKTRRVLIDLNRMIAEEAAHYNRKKFEEKSLSIKKSSPPKDYVSVWASIEKQILDECRNVSLNQLILNNEEWRDKEYRKRFSEEFLPERLSLFRQRFNDRVMIANELIETVRADKGKSFIARLEEEFYKDNLERREKVFRERLYDRTVHPTQMYSLRSELNFEELIERVVKDKNIPATLVQKTAQELIREYFGLNVAISSSEEPSELILDLKSMITAENYLQLYSDVPHQTFLSFWGDWDGSNRPSGQGHSLVAAVLIRNVAQQSRLLQALLRADKTVKIETSLLNEIEKLPETNKRFSKLLNEITQLTHQLEKRYRGVLPFNLKPGKIRQLGMKMRIAQDPLTSLWHHNDRLERKMLELRTQRRNALEYYFSLNKQIRKTLHALINFIPKNLDNAELLREASSYKDLLKRFVITPRIHQKMITAQDQFAIDTTVHNINEINEIAAKYGNPGMVLALQVSMSTTPEALISLDRKMRARREQSLRDNHNLEIPSVRLVPLFEDIDASKNLKNYLNKIWEYSLQSRRLNQTTGERFNEIISEVFIAGSDLSQQVGQAAGMNLFKEAKYELISWLSEKELVGKVRMKMGSGEPMQRQGGYYEPNSGRSAFLKSSDNGKRFSEHLSKSTKQSTVYARTPLLGVFSEGDLRTFQSNISEKLRYLPVSELSQLLFHVKESQKFYETEIVRAGEPLVETRLLFKTRGLKELERLTIGFKDKMFDESLNHFTENFRQILYGREEDVVGIHIISYFIARTTPSLRDRPTVRPGKGDSGNDSQKILRKISEMIPFSRYGSLLRAIAHNQSQTAVLGINQLTTGLFRALDSFAQKEFTSGEASAFIEDRILPHLPVYEILHTLRIYQDEKLQYLGKLENAFPAGNSAFLALREDMDSLNKYLILFQRELLRRHGLNVNDFFEADKFIPDLLPTLRPDIAVLLQQNLFNTEPEIFLSDIHGNVDPNWVESVRKLLRVPEEVKLWRKKIWDLLEQPVFQRVASFVELAIALHSLASKNGSAELSLGSRKIKLPTNLSHVIKASNDDNMHQFLAAAFEYLSIVSEGMVEVPINIIRAVKEVERIIKIEEQALSPKQQDLLRFYLLQIARLTGENG